MHRNPEFTCFQRPVSAATRQTVCQLHRSRDVLRGNRGFGRKARTAWHMRCRHPRLIAGPGLGPRQRPVDEGVVTMRSISREYADLAVRDLAGRDGILAANNAGCLALLQKDGVIIHQNSFAGSEVFIGIVAQPIGRPTLTAEYGLMV